MFEEKSDMNNYFPFLNVLILELTKQGRSVFPSTLMFLKTCIVAILLTHDYITLLIGLWQTEQIKYSFLELVNLCCMKFMSP